MNNIRWTGALSLCEGKITIFCANNVALVPDRLSMRPIKTKKELGARSAVRLHWRISQAGGLHKGFDDVASYLDSGRLEHRQTAVPVSKAACKFAHYDMGPGFLA